METGHSKHTLIRSVSFTQRDRLSWYSSELGMFDGNCISYRKHRRCCRLRGTQISHSYHQSARFTRRQYDYPGRCRHLNRRRQIYRNRDDAAYQSDQSCASNDGIQASKFGRVRSQICGNGRHIGPTRRCDIDLSREVGRTRLIDAVNPNTDGSPLNALVIAMSA